MKKILILANDVTTIVQFRKELIKALGNIGQGGEKDKKKTGLFKRFSKQG